MCVQRRANAWNTAVTYKLVTPGSSSASSVCEVIAPDACPVVIACDDTLKRTVDCPRRLSGGGTCDSLDHCSGSCVRPVHRGMRGTAYPNSHVYLASQQVRVGFRHPCLPGPNPQTRRPKTATHPTAQPFTPNSRHTDWAMLGGHPQSSCHTVKQCRVPHLP